MHSNIILSTKNHLNINIFFATIHFINKFQIMNYGSHGGGADFELVTQDGANFAVHKRLLISKSKFFRNLFVSDNSLVSYKMEVDSNDQQFQNFIRYLYNISPLVVTCENIEYFVNISVNYSFEELYVLCFNAYINEINGISMGDNINLVQLFMKNNEAYNENFINLDLAKFEKLCSHLYEGSEPEFSLVIKIIEKPFNINIKKKKIEILLNYYSKETCRNIYHDNRKFVSDNSHYFDVHLNKIDFVKGILHSSDDAI